MAKNPNTSTGKRTKVLGLICNVLLIGVTALTGAFSLILRLDTAASGEGLAEALGLVISLVFGVISVIMLIITLLFFGDTRRAKRNIYGAFPILFMLVAIVAIIVILYEALGSGLDPTSIIVFVFMAAVFALCIAYCLSRMGDRKKFVARQDGALD